MRADPLRGERGGGGLALEIESFLSPYEMARADRRVPFGAQRTQVRVTLSTLSFCPWLTVLSWYAQCNNQTDQETSGRD
jgi:hypothetical protein